MLPHGSHYVLYFWSFLSFEPGYRGKKWVWGLVPRSSTIVYLGNCTRESHYYRITFLEQKWKPIPQEVCVDDSITESREISSSTKTNSWECKSLMCTPHHGFSNIFIPVYRTPLFFSIIALTVIVNNLQILQFNLHCKAHPITWWEFMFGFWAVLGYRTFSFGTNLENFRLCMCV